MKKNSGSAKNRIKIGSAKDQEARQSQGSLLAKKPTTSPLKYEGKRVLV